MLFTSVCYGSDELYSLLADVFDHSCTSAQAFP